MAGLVSPADSWNRNYYLLLSGPTAGRSDEVCHAAGGSSEVRLSSGIDVISVRPSNLDG